MNRQRLKDKLLAVGTPYECQDCSINQWKGKKLSLHLDHINGINNDHRLENLRFLCPNCHSLTDTYCGKNNKSSFNSSNKKVSDEVLMQSMLVSENVREALRNVGLNGANNYQRVHRLAEKHKIFALMSPKKKITILVQTLKNSDIDFSKHGWVEKASFLIGITPQKTRQWIARNSPELLENAFLRHQV